MEGFPSIEDLRHWADGLEEVQNRLAPYFERAEPRQRAMAYLRGLMSTTERKNGWQLAELGVTRLGREKHTLRTRRRKSYEKVVSAASFDSPVLSFLFRENGQK